MKFFVHLCLALFAVFNVTALAARKGPYHAKRHQLSTKFMSEPEDWGGFKVRTYHEFSFAKKVKDKDVAAVASHGRFCAQIALKKEEGEALLAQFESGGL